MEDTGMKDTQQTRLTPAAGIKEIDSVQQREEIKLSIRSWYKEVLKRMSHDEPNETWEKLTGEDGTEVTRTITKATESNCAASTSTNEEVLGRPEEVVIMPADSSNEYNMLQDLAKMQLNISMG